MNIYGDYHTHTIYSHGKGEIIENALEAKKKNLKEIAITDHGFGHNLYAVERKNLEKMRKEINEAKEKTGLNIYLGVEANLLSKDGEIDVSKEELEKLDILLVGYHRFVKNSFVNKIKFTLMNMLFGKKHLKKLTQRNTEMIVNAMEKYPIDILTHLKHGQSVNLMQVAKKAVETKTYIELNASKMLFSKEEINEMVKLGVKFIIDSDAHIPEKVGKVDNILAIVDEFNIPHENIVNLDKKPEFKRIK